MSETNWIKCSERLPEKDGRYLVTTKSRSETSVDNYWLGSGWTKWASHYVIAWAELPEPYQGKK